MVVSKIFYFHPYSEKLSNLTNIFQMGWNHQLDEKKVDDSKKSPTGWSIERSPKKPEYLIARLQLP